MTLYITDCFASLAMTVVEEIASSSASGGLLAMTKGLQKDDFFLNLEDAGLGLGLPVSWDNESLRRQVIKALRTLEDRYNLIEVEFYHASDAHVTILPVQGESFTIETDTLDPRDKEIPQRLKFLLLVKELLEKEGKDLDSVPQKEIMRRFHIAERTLEKALAGGSEKVID